MMNLYAEIIKTMREANARGVIREYKCYTCSEFKPMTWENEYTFLDAGEETTALICDDCKAKGRHTQLP